MLRTHVSLQLGTDHLTQLTHCIVPVGFPRDRVADQERGFLPLTSILRTSTTDCQPRGRPKFDIPSSVSTEYAALTPSQSQTVESQGPSVLVQRRGLLRGSGVGFGQPGRASWRRQSFGKWVELGLVCSFRYGSGRWFVSKVAKRLTSGITGHLH